MTGYGTAAADSEAVKAAVTVRSLNHRYLDVSVHVSRRLQALETDIKRVVQERISRGRVELAVQATFTRDEEAVVVAPRPIVTGLVRTLRQIQNEHALAGEVTVADVARFPGALEVVESPAGIDDERRQELLAVVGARAGRAAGNARRRGHAPRRRTSRGALDAIDGAAATDRAPSRSPGRRARRDALADKVRSALPDLALDESRLYQEVVRLVDRHDVAEELQRLRSHVAQAREALEAQGPSGKRLDFLAQELAREANTIGSKAASAEVVQEVVALKSEIERLREQVQNVE